MTVKNSTLIIIIGFPPELFNCRGSSVFSFKYHFSFSFGGIFILVLTFLYVTVVRLMTTLNK